MLTEFKKFAIKGNMIDMAVGIMIGAAFGKIVSSLVADILMPPIGIVVGGVDFSRFVYTLRKATATTDAVTINYGLFINNLLDFLIIALVMFFVVRQMNRLKKKEETKASEPTEHVRLLREIRDQLRKD